MGHKTGCETSPGSSMSFWASKLFWVVVLCMLICAVPAFSAQRVQSVDVADTPDSVIITVTAARPVSMQTGSIGERCLVFDIPGMFDAKWRGERVSVNSGGVRYVKCEQFRMRPALARIMVVGSFSLDKSVSYEDCRRTVVISIPKENLSSVELASETPAEPEKTEVTEEAPAVAEVPAEAEEAPAEVVIEKVAGSRESTGPVSSMSLPEMSTMPAAPSHIVAAVPPKSVVVAMEPSTLPHPTMVASAEPVIVSMAKPVVADIEPRVSLDFVATDIHDVLKGLSMQGNVNIVAGPEVKGDVTVTLNNVTVEEALKLVTGMSGYKFAKDGDTYIVGTPDSLRTVLSGSSSLESDMTSVVLTLKYADAEMVGTMMKDQFGITMVSSKPKEVESGAKDNKITLSSGPSILVLTGSRGKVEAAKNIVEAIEASLADSEADSVIDLYEMKHANIYETASLLSTSVPGLSVRIGPNEGFDLLCPRAVDMSSTSGAGGGASGGSTSGGTGNTGATGAQTQKADPKILILRGSPDDVAKARNLLADIDVKLPMIVIEAKVVDITNDDSKNVGIKWDTEGLVSSTTLTENNSPTDSAIKFGRLSRSALSFTGRINALVEKGKAKVLANPNVLAMDGKPSTFFVGDEVKYVVQVTVSDNGTTVTTETARVGVQLLTVSRVSSDGYITMNIHPEVSVISAWITTPADLILPEISRRYVDTTIRVKDGETIVIGGLIKSEETSTIGGIPFLKDLPILGYLFRTDNISKTDSEVMMFITPRVVTDEE